VRQTVCICGIGAGGLTKGWVCGVAEKNMIGLDLRLGPIHKKYGQVGHLDVQQG
jgi:hypothetical protein